MPAIRNINGFGLFPRRLKAGVMAAPVKSDRSCTIPAAWTDQRELRVRIEGGNKAGMKHRSISILLLSADFRRSETDDFFQVASLAQPPAEKPQHPPVAPPSKRLNLLALAAYMAAQPPAIAQGSKARGPHQRPAPLEQQPKEAFHKKHDDIRACR